MSILSGSAIEVAVKCAVVFLFSLIALTLVGRRHSPSAYENTSSTAESRFQLEGHENYRRTRNRISRLAIGSVITGCVLAVFIAVLLSLAATQLLSRLG